MKKKVTAKGLDEVFDVEEETNIDLPTSVDGDDSIAVLDDDVGREVNPTKAKLEDSDYIRKELKDLVAMAKSAMDTALAAQEEEANTWTTRSVMDLVATVNTTLQGLLQLNKVEEEIALKKGDHKPQQPHVAANVIITTTADLIEQITDKIGDDNIIEAKVIKKTKKKK